jgi:TolA-binding protein
VENKRLRNTFDMNAMQKEIKGYYLSVVGDTYLGLNAYSKALRFYHDALEEDPTLFSYDPALYSHMARASYSLKDFAKAKEYILLAINLGNPANKAAHLLEMGDCLYQLGEKEKAMSIFAEVENISPKSDSGIIAKLRTARILRERDLETAGELTDKTFYEIMDIYESLKTSDEYQEGPLGSLVKIRIAQTFSLREDWDNALEAYYRAWIDTKNDDPIHLYAQAEAEKTILSRLGALYQEDHYDLIYDLYTIYEDSFMKDITQGDAMFILGDSMRRLDYPDKARPLLITVTKSTSPRKPQAIATLFTMDYHLGNYHQALQWNSAYLVGYPDGPAAGLMRETRGELLYHMNILEEAAVYLEPIAAKGDEKSLKALSMLAGIHRRLENPQKERDTLEKIIAYHGLVTSPIIERALYARAKQLIATKDNPRAETLLHEMIVTYPESSYKDWARYHLATIAHASDKPAEARTLLTSVIRNSTDSVLLNTASSYLKEMDLVTSLDEFNNLKNRFGGN